MTKVQALSKEINERIVRQCILVLLDDDVSAAEMIAMIRKRADHGPLED